MKVHHLVDLAVLVFVVIRVVLDVRMVVDNLVQHVPVHALMDAKLPVQDVHPHAKEDVEILVERTVQVVVGLDVLVVVQDVLLIVLMIAILTVREDVEKLARAHV